MIYSTVSGRFPLALVAIAIFAGSLTFFITRDRAPRLLPSTAVPAVRPTAASSNESAIHFYAARVQRDPEDARSQNALAESYLRRVRQTGNEDDLPLALSAARASLAAVPAPKNAGGLTALAHAEFSNHLFADARDHACQLLELAPSPVEALAILCDAQLELGAYAEAAEALKKMQIADSENPASRIRAARSEVIHGNPAAARQHLAAALASLRAQTDSPHDTIAWCLWQLGEIAFSTGDYATAEKEQNAALQEAPDDFRALASLARLAAVRGDNATAIARYEQAIRIAPALETMAALGDLYHLGGREKDAAICHDLVVQLGTHSQKIHGTPFDRRLALFYADHSLQPEAAYALARGEYDSGRRDIYGADALAWTALKAGRLAEARTASSEALRLGTLDARLLHHAGLIAQAGGDLPAARDLLQRALALNPHFDPLQATSAKEALKK